MTLNVNITNKTSVSSADINWICFGLDGSGTDANWSYVSIDKSGNASLEKFSVGQNCAPLFNSIKTLDSFKSLPELWSGQILFIYNGLPKTFNIVKSASSDYHGIGVQTPGFTPGTADAETLFVVVEFTYSGDIWCDSTIVDYFCAPVSLEVIGTTTKTNGIMKSGSNRNSIFDQIKKLGAPWSNLIMYDAKKNYVRVLGSQHGVEQGIIPNNYYDDYVDHTWAKYVDTGSETLTVNCPTFGTYVGTTNAATGKFTFKQAGKADVVINKPAPGKSFDIFGCVGTLNAPNNTPLGEIAAIVGAALNRTVLYDKDTQPYCTSSDFYKLTDGTWAATNEYAKAVHDNYQSGIYAFPYDDVCSSDSPLIQVSNPTQFNITLSAWS